MKYYFVIDTDTYAGNFEREIAAYITGSVGDCGVGSAVAESAKKDISKEVSSEYDDLIAHEPDEHGCHRPCKIYPTPGYYNNGYGKHFKDDNRNGTKFPAYLSVAIPLFKAPSGKIVQVMKDRAFEFESFVYKRMGKKIGCRTEPGKFKVTGFRLVSEKTITKEIKL